MCMAFTAHIVATFFIRRWMACLRGCVCVGGPLIAFMFPLFQMYPARNFQNPACFVEGGDSLT